MYGQLNAQADVTADGGTSVSVTVTVQVPIEVLDASYGVDWTVVELVSATRAAIDAWRGDHLGSAVRRILDRAQTVHGLTLEQLRARDQSPPMVRIRQAVMADLRRAGLAYPAIGHLLDRDHTTVMHGVRAHRARQAEGFEGAVA